MMETGAQVCRVCERVIYLGYYDGGDGPYCNNCHNQRLRSRQPYTMPIDIMGGPTRTEHHQLWERLNAIEKRVEKLEKDDK